MAEKPGSTGQAEKDGESERFNDTLKRMLKTPPDPKDRRGGGAASVDKDGFSRKSAKRGSD